MKVTITIEIDTATTPPLVSVTTTDEAEDPAQTSIADFIKKSSRTWDRTMEPSMGFTYYDKHRKGILRCSRCGKVGYNIRTHDRHQDL